MCLFSLTKALQIFYLLHFSSCIFIILFFTSIFIILSCIFFLQILYISHVSSSSCHFRKCLECYVNKRVRYACALPTQPCNLTTSVHIAYFELAYLAPFLIFLRLFGTLFFSCFLLIFILDIEFTSHYLA